MAGWKIVSCPFDLSGKRIYRKSRAPISLPARILENRGGNNDSRAPSSPPPPTTGIKYSSPPETVPCSCLHKWPKFASLTVIIRIFGETRFTAKREMKDRVWTRTNERRRMVEGGWEGETRLLVGRVKFVDLTKDLEFHARISTMFDKNFEGNRGRNLDGCVRRSRLRKPSRDGFHEGWRQLGGVEKYRKQERETRNPLQFF